MHSYYLCDIVEFDILFYKENKILITGKYRKLNYNLTAEYTNLYVI